MLVASPIALLVALWGMSGVRALELRVENMNSSQCQVAAPGEPSDFPARVRAMAGPRPGAPTPR